MQVKIRSPFQPLLEMEGIFREVFGHNFPTWTLSETNIIPMSEDNKRKLYLTKDFSEDDEGNYRLWVELPGIEKKDILVKLDQGSVGISASRGKEGDPHYRLFDLTYEIPENSDAAKLTASFENGLLWIIIPKKEEAKSREITIS